MQNLKNLQDSELIALYQSGVEEAFYELVMRYKNKVFTTIVVIVKDANEAEDLLQDTFIRAIRTIKSGKYNEEGKFLPWILRIAHNMAIDHFRRNRRFPTVQVEEEYKGRHAAFLEDSQETQQIRKESHERLRELIRRLPAPQREVLMMRHYMKMSFQEIADITGVSINTALGRMRYALINLRKQMAEIESALTNC